MKKVFSLVYLFAVLALGCAFAFDAFGFQAFVCAALSLDAHTGGMVFTMATLAPFPVDTELTAIAVAYKNDKFIADEVLPRVPVGKQSFKHRLYSLASGLTIPETRVGRISAPNRVEFGFTESSSSTEDNGLDDGIPRSDIDNAPANYSPQGHATEMLTNLIMLDREKRVADMVFGAANYGSSNKATLSGTSQWSDHTDSDPITAILTALDSCVMRPNIAVLGNAVWTKVRTHPKVVKATNRNSGDAGVAARAAVAEMLELDEILVGQGWYNSAKPGQTPTAVRLWGKFAAFLYRDRLADTRGGTTFGYTAQWGDRVSGQWEDKDIGLHGGVRVRVGESVKELITANDLGYLFSAAVA